MKRIHSDLSIKLALYFYISHDLVTGMILAVPKFMRELGRVSNFN